MHVNRFICNSNYAWKSVKFVFDNECFISGLSNNHYPKPIVLSKVVVLDRCDKNFIYYFLDEKTFPLMNKLYLNSHPCEPVVVEWMENRAFDIDIYIHEKWEIFIKRWGYENSAVKIISNAEYEKFLPSNVRSKY